MRRHRIFFCGHISAKNFEQHRESLSEVNEKYDELRKMSHPQGLETFLLWLMGRSMCGEVTLKVPRTALIVTISTPSESLGPRVNVWDLLRCYLRMLCIYDPTNLTQEIKSCSAVHPEIISQQSRKKAHMVRFCNIISRP